MNRIVLIVNELQIEEITLSDFEPFSRPSQELKMVASEVLFHSIPHLTSNLITITPKKSVNNQLIIILFIITHLVSAPHLPIDVFKNLFVNEVDAKFL